MEQNNNGNANELLLFFAMKNINPNELCVESGFDMRCIMNGSWGNGIYFHENASKCNTMAFSPTETQHQIFLVNVLVGDSYKCVANSNLGAPPVKSMSPQLIRYDSCFGEENGSRIYILYTFVSRAYPSYLITYSLAQSSPLSSPQTPSPPPKPGIFPFFNKKK